MKQFIFDGRLGKDAEVATTSGGQQYLRFRVANNTYSKTDGEKTEWIDVVCFDPFLVKSKSQVLKKGYYVIVSGSLDVSVSTLQDGRTFINQKVNAISIEVPNFGRNDENAVNEQNGAQQAVAAPQPTMMSQQPVMAPQQAPMMPQQPAMPQQGQYVAHAPAQPQYAQGYQPQMAAQPTMMPQQAPFTAPAQHSNVTVDNDLPF